MYHWTKLRRTKGAVNLQLPLDHDGCVPSYAVITDGETHEIRMPRALQLPARAIIAIDRGYVDYLFLDSLTEQGVLLSPGSKTTRCSALRAKGMHHAMPSWLTI